MRISDWSSDVCSSDLVATFSSPSLRSHPCDQMTIGSFIVRRSSSFTPSSCGATLTSLPSFSGLSSWVKPSVTEASHNMQIGRASCRARVCQYVLVSVVAGALRQKETVRQTNYKNDILDIII